MRLRGVSLRTKIIAWSFVPTVIILVTVALVTFTAYQQVTEELVIERDRDLARLSADQLGVELSEYATLLAEYSALLADLGRNISIDTNDPAAQRAVLSQARGRLDVFDAGVLVLNNQGTIVAAEPERPEVLGRNWSDRSYFRQMLRFPEPVFSGVVADGPEGAEVIVVAVPIKGSQGQFLGVIAGMFQVDPTTISPLYDPITRRIRSDESSNAYLVDDTGRVLYHSDTERIGEDFSAQTLVQQVLRREVGSLRTNDADGSEIIASFAPVPGTPWSLITQENWDALISAGRGYRQFLLLLLGLGVVVPALVVAVGVRRITRPIRELIQATQEVAGGNFDQTITAQTGDELEDLAEQFNLMSAQLQEMVGTLEQRVVDLKQAEEALRKSEERYRGLFDGVPVGLYRATPAGQMVDANPASAQILGFSERETLLAVNAADLYVNPEDRLRWQALMEREGLVRDFEAQFYRNDGTIIWLDDTARAVRDEQGRVLYYEGSLEDVTKRKRAEAELQKYQEHLEDLAEERTAALRKTNEQLQQEIAERVRVERRLRESEKVNVRLYEQAQQDAETKARLLDEVNHRVKNNLTGIIGMLYVTRRYARAAEGRESYLTILGELIYRIEGLATVHNLLSAAEWSSLPLSELTTQIIHSALQSLPPDKRVLTNVPTTNPVQVTPKQANSLALVINELTTNTIKYALLEHQTARITVRIAHEGETIVFEFQDDGPGFPEEVLRLERHNVGLYLIQSIVRKDLGGELVLRNNQGAVTVIRFPVNGDSIVKSLV